MGAGWLGALLQSAYRVGGLPARRVTWTLTLLFSAWALLDIFSFRISGGMSQATFDAMVRARVVTAAPDPRIVILDIDEPSLSRMGKEFGRWPWPRDTLASTLAWIAKQEPAAVVWDIVFSEADRQNPGADAAFDAAIRAHAHSHFSVVRLPPINDPLSQIRQAELPGLWLPGSPPSAGPASTVALIPPALPAIAAGRMGFNNGYVDPDGILRRYRYAEPLADGSTLQSVVLSALGSIDPRAQAQLLRRIGEAQGTKDELIAWRQQADAYPRISFADVFAIADGGKSTAHIPDFRGKIVIIGSTAPSLHDIHPTPLSPTQAGVDSLATALDNAMNQRFISELPRWLQALVAIALCIGLGLWVQLRNLASLAPALFALPAGLMAVSYLSLNGSPVFLDLQLPAGLALVLLGVLRYWNNLRRRHWCAFPADAPQPWAMLPLERRQAWLEDALDQLIDHVETVAPACRIIACDSHVSWPNSLRWPELARRAAVVGPREELALLRTALLQEGGDHLAQRVGPVSESQQPLCRDTLAARLQQDWPLSDPAATVTKETQVP
jgi:adenylate cyclase